MKKVFFVLLSMVLSVSVMAQQKIQLRSADKAECVKSDMRGLKASFSFSTIEAQDYVCDRGTFSWLSLPNTVIGGNEGDPQIPVVNQLIAVPFGAQPRVEITSYSTTDYRLDEYGIHTLVPRQPSLRKDQRPEDVPFVYNESAYQTRGLRSAPTASVYVDGIMRGVQVGKMCFEPVSYDPVSNTLRVFNDIEVEVHFDGADSQATEEMLVKTYSPYFDIVYAQLFNDRMVRDVYSQHPDLYTTPVKMVVITTSTYANNATFQNWVKWKKQKGIYTTVYTTATTGTSSSDIKSFLRNLYSTDLPTFVVTVGDTGDVTYSMSSSTTSKVTDLYYSSTTDSDLYPEVFYSRMPVSTTTELANLLNKIMTYEKYTMTTPSYLGNTLLIAGWDSSWTATVGKPTIQYANNYYFNSSNNINPYVYLTTQSSQSGCYTNINNVGFVNYTAHGDNTMWYDPQFTVSNVSSLTNNDKYFWAMGNCCLAANWGYSSTCLAEALLRAQNKGAFGYIGSCPETYWYEDYYFGVGATTTMNTMPTQAQTTTGCYDAMFNDSGFNTLNAVPYIGNIAVAYAHAGSYSYSTSDKYYWEAYHCLGDGSVMPYHAVPAANNVSHDSALPLGSSSFTVRAVAGSYVSITVNDEIIGVAQVPSNGTVNVPITPQNEAGNAMIVVTRNQRQPYIATIPMVGGAQYTITATANPSNAGTVTGGGLLYENTTCTLTAVANSGWDFVNWNDGSTQNPRSFTVTGNASYTANFVTVPERTITLASVMNGTIGCDHTTAYKNDIITLTANPASGYNLESWVVFKTGDLNTTITVSNNQFTMPDYDVTVSAIFSKPAGGEVTIGSGTGTDAGSDLPTDVYYKYSLSQQIYTSAELGGAGTITAISFYYNSSSSSGNRTMDIYMTHTSSSTITSWQTESNNNKVYSGSHNFTQGWNTITLNTPFEYNGTSNVLLTVDDNTGSYSVSQFIYFYTYSTGANRAIYYRNDYTNPSATGSNSNSATKVQYNAQMKVMKEVPSDEGYLSVSPTNMSGFQADAGFASSDPQIISIIGNNLQANLTITAPTGYEVCTTQNGTYNSTLTLTPSNGSLRSNVYVRLGSNVNPGNYNGNLTLTSGTVSATITLSGTVIDTGQQYYISVSANPVEGGNVTGDGEYDYNASVTLTATANEGYTFTNWTLNGTEVSTDATYNIIVTGAADYVANFTLNSYMVTATPNTVEGGSVTIHSGRNRDDLVYDFEDGTSQGWTILQGPNGDSPNNWSHSSTYDEEYSTGHGHNATDGFMLSESYLIEGVGSVHPDNYLVSPQILLGGSIHFWATNVDNGYAEHFAVAVSTTGNNDASCFSTVQEWTFAAKAEGTGGTRSLNNGTWYEYTVDLSAFVGLGYVAIHHFNCYDQWLLCVDDITIVEGEPYTGEVSGTFNHGETCTVTASANEGYTFVNWTEDDVVVSTDDAYSFVVTGERNLIANFEASTPTVAQTIEFEEGWNWWAPNIDITLEAFEAALGSYGISIVSQNGDTDINSNFGWGGNLDAIEVGKMYMVNTNAACTFTVNGYLVDPADYPVTINPDANWIGFIGTEEMSLNEAFSGFTPTHMDNIKTRTGSAVYYQGRGWKGKITTLVPGEGFIYTSKASASQTFTYPSGE